MPMRLKRKTIGWSRSAANRLDVTTAKKDLGPQQIQITFGGGFQNASEVGAALREIEMLLLSPATFQADMEQTSD